MNAITLGNPNLFVKGIVEAIITDPATGNIIGYDNVASESAITSTVNMGEITGGLGNPLVMNIPDTTRITGSLTSQAFSLEQRALASGGNISYNAIVPVCETITATNATLTVTQTPVKAYGQSASDTYGWCYVRPHGQQTYEGTNYGVDLGSKEVQNFVALVGSQYDVYYFVNMASAKVLPLSTSFNPTVASVRLKYAVYAKQNNSVSNGTLQGYLHFVVPYAQFTGDVGVNANQTTNGTTNYDWTAIAPDNGIMSCVDCGDGGSNLAYYVYVPCGNATQDVQALIVVAGGVIQSAESTEQLSVQLPVRYYMPNGETVQPIYTDLMYTGNIGTASKVYATETQPSQIIGTGGKTLGTVSYDGIVTLAANAYGSGWVEICLNKSAEEFLTTQVFIDIAPNDAG